MTKRCASWSLFGIVAAACVGRTLPLAIAQPPDGVVRPQYLRAYLGKDHGAALRVYTVSWDVHRSTRYVEFVERAPTVQVRLSHPIGTPEARREAHLQMETVKRWVGDEFVSLLSVHELDENGQLTEARPVALLPALHPGEHGMRGGTRPTLADRPRWMPWVNTQLIVLGENRWLLLCTAEVSQSWSHPRAYLITEAPREKVRMKRKEMLPFCRLPGNPFLSVPQSRLHFNSSAQVGKRVFVSARGGWIAEIDTARAMWTALRRPFGPAEVYLSAADDVLRAVVAKEHAEGTDLTEYESADGEAWTRIGGLPSPPESPCTWRFIDDSWFFVPTDLPSRKSAKNVLYKLDRSRGWKRILHKEGHIQQVIMAWDVVPGEQQDLLTFLCGTPDARGAVNIRASFYSSGK